MDDSAYNRGIDMTNIDMGNRNIDGGMGRTVIQRGYGFAFQSVLSIPPALVKHSFYSERIKINESITDATK
jgi:hypothetical protein